MDRGQPLKMSKRAGRIVNLRDVIDEVGKDVVRFIMLTRKNDAPLEFDLTKVTEQSRDNPCGTCSTPTRGSARCGATPSPRGSRWTALALAGAPLAHLVEPEELALIRLMADLPAHPGGGDHPSRAAPDRFLPRRSGGKLPRALESG